MVQDAVQTAVQIAHGLTRSTRERASAAAHALLGKAGLEDVAADAQDRVGKVADEILAAGRANGQLINSFVSHEVDQAVDRLGLARRSDLDDLATEIAGLRAAVASLTVQLEQAAAAAEAQAMAAAPRRRSPRASAASPAAGFDGDADGPDGFAAPTPVTPSRRPATKKAPAKKAAARKAPSAKAATTAPAVKAPATKASATKASATKASATKAPAKRTRKAASTIETTFDAPPVVPTDPIESDGVADVIETGTVVGPFEPDPIEVRAPSAPTDADISDPDGDGR